MKSTNTGKRSDHLTGFQKSLNLPIDIKRRIAEIQYEYKEYMEKKEK